MKVRYWQNFTKRKNSTKRPDLTQGTEIEVYLKDNCSLENPVFIIDDDLKTWSYCYAPSLSRYYFITDIISISSYEYEVHCTLDVAGTFRDSIRAYTTFVERSASAYDVMIRDEALSMQQDLIYSAIAGSETRLSSQGVFIVPIGGKSGLQLCLFNSLASAGAFFNGTQFKDPSGQIPTLSKLDDIFTAIGFSFFNIQDYMGSPYWLPIALGDISDGSQNITAGMFETTINCVIGSPFNFPPITGTLNIPANYYTDFRSRDPRFSHYNVWLPGVGVIELNTYDASEGNLYFTMSVDIATGNVNYIIENSNGAIITSVNGSLKVPLPFGQAVMDWSAPITETAKGITQGVMVGGGAGAVIGGVSGLITGIDALMSPQVSITNGGGNMIVIQDRPDIFVSVENYGSKEFPIYEYGRPLCQYVTLGNLSGFVKCSNASIPINALDHVRDEINTMLNTGIYIE